MDRRAPETVSSDLVQGDPLVYLSVVPAAVQHHAAELVALAQLFDDDLRKAVDGHLHQLELVAFTQGPSRLIGYVALLDELRLLVAASGPADSEGRSDG